MNNELTSIQNREYITGFMRRRSIIALCAGIIELAGVFCGIILGLGRTARFSGDNLISAYIYFTMISNSLAAIAVAFSIPFAVEGIKTKRLILPRWVTVLMFISASSIAIVPLMVFSFMRWVPSDLAFGDGGVFTHIMCPLLVILSFFQIESGHRYTLSECVLACIPFNLYMIVYYIMVFLIGPDNGGWQDIYSIGEHINPLFVIPIGMILSFVISLIISKISNTLSENRKNNRFRYWTRDIEPVEVLVEAYGLGIMVSENIEQGTIQVPYDILEELARRYGIDPSKLAKAFFTGFEIGIKKNKQLTMV